MKKRAAWFIAIGILCLVLLAVCVSDISRSFVVRVDNNSWSANEPTPVSAPVTYTDKNGVTRSIADDPPASEWDGPWDNNLVAPSEEVWGVTPDGDSDYLRSTDFKTYEDYRAYMDYKYHNDDPEATPPVIHYKDPSAGTAVERNLDPGPGPDMNPSYRNG